MEFGAFDKEREILPLTMFDNKMDRKSVVSFNFLPIILFFPWDLMIDVVFMSFYGARTQTSKSLKR
jgi:hypothetical protein